MTAGSTVASMTADSTVASMTADSTICPRGSRKRACVQDTERGWLGEDAEQGVDFAELDTERMEIKSLLDDNFRRFSKILPTRTLLALTNLESKDNKGEEPESFLQTSIAISFNSKVTYTWRYYPLYIAV